MEVKNKKDTSDDFNRWMIENHMSVDIITREFMHIAFNGGMQCAMENKNNNIDNERCEGNER